MSDHIASAKNEVINNTNILTTMGDDRSVFSKAPPSQNRPPISNYQPQRPQQQPQPRFPQTSYPRFAPRGPEAQQRPPFPVSQNQDPRQNPIGQNLPPQRFAAHIPNTGRPPPPFVQRQGSVSGRAATQDSRNEQVFDRGGSNVVRNTSQVMEEIGPKGNFEKQVQRQNSSDSNRALSEERGLLGQKLVDPQNTEQYNEQTKQNSSKLIKQKSGEILPEINKIKNPDNLINSVQKNEQKVEQSKTPQNDPHLKQKLPPQGSVEMKTLNRDELETFEKKKDYSELSKSKEELSRPPSRAQSVEYSKKDENISRPSSRGPADPAKSYSNSQIINRPLSRLQSTNEIQMVNDDKNTKLDSSKVNTTIEITAASPLKKNDTTNQKPSDIILANNRNTLYRSDSFRKSMEFPYLLKPDGDNDSGVDESTQGNENRNTENHQKSSKRSSKIPSPKASETPTKEKSIVKNSRSPSLKSPGEVSGTTTPGGSEKKKVPMNKIQVGAAPSPNLKEVKSKIGSLSNATYKPGGGNVKIENVKLSFEAKPRIAAKNENYVPHGGEKKIVSQKLQWNAKSKIGSLENTSHKPKGGEKKIESVKLDFKDRAKPKVGSKDNVKYMPGGGDIKIENKKLEFKAQSKIGSLGNVKHKPGGGDKKIFDDKNYIRQKSGNSLTNSQKIDEEIEEMNFEEHRPMISSARTLSKSVSEEFTGRSLPRSSSARLTPRLTRTCSLRRSLKKCADKDNTDRPRWRF